MTENLGGLKSSQIFDLAMLAWNDKTRAGRFVSQVAMHKLENVER